jgi:hypothetical protein
MKIYLVIGCTEYEGEDIVKVFDNKEVADAYASVLNRHTKREERWGDVEERKEWVASSPPGYIEHARFKVLSYEVEHANTVKEGRRMNTCAACTHFRRGKWHESLGSGPQHSGTCRLLCAVLKIENPNMLLEDEITLQDTFGCVMHKDKQ